jgi:hypothetical protein
MIDIASGEVEDQAPEPSTEGKDAAAVSLGRRGGLKGGKASPDFSHNIGASGLRISESCCGPTTSRSFEDNPDADRVYRGTA